MHPTLTWHMSDWLALIKSRFQQQVGGASVPMTSDRSKNRKKTAVSKLRAFWPSVIRIPITHMRENKEKQNSSMLKLKLIRCFSSPCCCHEQLRVKPIHWRRFCKGHIRLVAIQIQQVKAATLEVGQTQPDGTNNGWGDAGKNGT